MAEKDVQIDVEITAQEGRESVKFSGAYNVSFEVPQSKAPFAGELDAEDFNAIFTGHFDLCKNARIREVAERGIPFSVGVPMNQLGFLFPKDRKGQAMVYMSPVLPNASGSEETFFGDTNQDLARRRREEILRQKKFAELAQQVQHQQAASTASGQSVVNAVSQEPAQAVPQHGSESSGRLVRKHVRRRPLPRFPLPEESPRQTPRRPVEDDSDSSGDGLDRFIYRTVHAIVLASAVGVALFNNRDRIAAWFEKTVASLDAGSPGSSVPGGNASAENKETLPLSKPLELVLERSKRAFLADSKTWRDNILKRDAVSEYFLGGKFRYMDVEAGEYNGEKQNLYRFSLIGEKSGQLDAKAGTDKQYLSTSLADAVNLLLETGAVDQNSVKKWIIWTYQKSFGITLRPELLKLRWKSGNQLDAVFYSPEAEFPVTAGIEVVKKMDPGEDQPGGNVSKEREPQDILGKENRLLLPTGLSPQHDVVVPQSLMKSNPEFTLKFGDTWTWKGITAETISQHISSFEDRVKTKGDRRTVGTAFKRQVPIDYIAPLVDRNDPMIQQLSASILKDIPAKNHQGRIAALYRFVQRLPYRTEYDTDIDRPSFITLFNGGGDCNNLTILFNELMLAAGYDTSIFRVAFDKNHYVTHTRGGIPAKYFPAARTWTNGPNKWVPIELAGKQSFVPGQEAWGADEMTFLIEEMPR